jgi:broad specificity phosphatase PhoE
LQDEKITAIYSSPLRRAIDTAEAIAVHHKLQVQVTPALRELEVGELEGVLVESLGNDFSSYLVNWREGDGLEKLPGGESLGDLRARAWSFVEQLISRHQGTVVAVSHYFVILSIICAALGLPPNGIRRFRISVSSMSVLEFKNGMPCLSLLGDTCYLE